jgi:hypothetical protein
MVSRRTSVRLFFLSLLQQSDYYFYFSNANNACHR